MAREFSAGGIVLRRIAGEWHLAAIRPRRETQPTPSGKPRKAAVLALPKGIIDPGERPETTAQREVREETGLEARLVSKLGDVKYVYRRTWGDGERVFKIVSFYLFIYENGQLGDIADNMRHEVEAAEWVPLRDGPRRLSYSGEKDMARRAEKYVGEHQDIESK